MKINGLKKVFKVYTMHASKEVTQFIKHATSGKMNQNLMNTYAFENISRSLINLNK